ncbi:Mpo1 family 2-hydroxy fatty acid dioxygenase [Kordiimonas aquimaris]|uniref:Mpo1 family 2-hydroxy fatty acid dioxygenase n=1 Tax=Kordiimonas aquimaris TaxID=707591 RepID=UPI0021D3B87D|nr:Mpo1-like protein [Kordiimonas aquimaris]
MRNWFYEQMAMYSAYHRDKRNQMTHHVGVPMIVFSLMVLGAQVSLGNTDFGSVTLSGVLIAALLVVYTISVPLVGILCAVIYGVLLVLAQQIAGVGTEIALTAFAVLFVLGWIIQFWGHAFEGRKPALFDNALQIFMAPSFLVAEILFSLGMLGGLRSEMQSRMGRYLPENEAG